ncbi:energy-coupling factor transporter transmembrane component T [Levilactobacillus namurensis]|uniref:energy-coupling factor transporter transmembrane component T n=1 Tax=Levilactobacillus namurensis TaxID=380393 RepID=UPI0004647D55|nr:energy-coupling factor transporter transmembrane component T [Levilactobacillus namurensis]
MRAGTVSELEFFSQLHPLTVLCYFVQLFTILLIFNHLVISVGLVICIVGVCYWYFDTEKVKMLVIGSSSLMAMIVLFNVLLNQSGRAVLLRLSIGPIKLQLTQTAIIYGLTMGLMLGGMVITFVLFNGVVTAPKLNYLLFPIAPRLAMLMMISLRFVDLFIQKMRRLAIYQKTKNINVAEGNFYQRLKKVGQLLRIILIDAISGAMETATLMEARGFGAHRRSQYQYFRFHIMDGVFLGLTMVIFCTSVYLRFQGWGWTSDVTDLNWGVVQDWWLLGLNSLFCLMPLFGEGAYRLCEN